MVKRRKWRYKESTCSWRRKSKRGRKHREREGKEKRDEEREREGYNGEQ